MSFCDYLPGDNINGTAFLTINPERDRYPLPNIDEILDELNECQHFSILDAASGFLQIPMNDSSIGKTGFTCKYGTYEYLVMPMGLTYAPAIFQRLMNDVMRSCLGRHALVYVDDIIVFSKTIEDHHDHIREILSALPEAGITLKTIKCKIGATHIDFLGHHVSGKGLRLQKSKVQKLDGMRDPVSASEVTSILGFARSLSHIYPKLLSHRGATELLNSEDVPWTFGEAEKQACQQLRDILTRAPLLAHFNPVETQILTTDASTSPLGAICHKAPMEPSRTNG